MKREEIIPYLTPANLARLTDQEREIIRLRFGLDGPARRLEEVAGYIVIRDGLDRFSRERVRQIEGHALKKLRAMEPE